MVWWTKAALCLGLAAATLGCASGNSWTASLPWSGKSQGQVASNSKSYPAYQDAQKAHRDAPPPEEKSNEPGTMAKFTGAVSTGGSKAWNSMTSVFRRDSKKPEAAPQKPASAAPGNDAPKGNGATMHVSLAQVQERAGQFDTAAREYETALKYDPNHFDALLGYARLRDRQNNFAEATRLYQQAVRTHPQEAVAYNDLALCLARQGRKEDAVAALKQAVRLQPARTLYRNNLAKVLLDLGRQQEALEQLIVAHQPPVAHYNMGYLLSQQGDQQGALRYFSRAVELDPNFNEARRWVELLSAQQPADPSAPPADAPTAAGGYPAEPASPGFQAPLGPRYSPESVAPPTQPVEEQGPRLGPAAAAGAPMHR
jgi:tetratricopeptide (TPR) repeat protein